MPLPTGTRLGAYEILGPLGAGGMGEVYRAKDTRLDREAAIKVLPAAVAQDRERLARFEREAKVLASLNHPNIAQIYGLEENGDTRALVMELVPGDILTTPQPLETAVLYARQIAEALEAAHEKGITHRDLKPANIMITPEGVVKVLDFGLASVPSREAVSGEAANSPTMTMAATQAGMIMGTAAYMSPEQAAGKPVDRRSDIWSFGVILYEMLVGKKLFAGETLSHTLADVLRAEIDLTLIPASTPEAIRDLIERCLDRDVKTRLQVISEARILLQRPLRRSVTPLVAPAKASRIPWAVAGVLAMATLGTAIWAIRATSQAPAVTRLGMVNFTMDLAPAEMLGPAVSSDGNRPSRTALAISPNGDTVFFVGDRDGKSMLYRRPLAESTATVIAGTEGAMYPFFSPDGQWVGFAAPGGTVGAGAKLKKVAAGGGMPIDLCAVGAANFFEGASWGSAGVVVFSDGAGLKTVPDSGGTPTTLIERSNSRKLSPTFLPDGQTVLFTDLPSDSNWEKAHVDSIHIPTKQRKTLLTNATDARYSPTGHLVFLRNGALLAVAFNAAGGELSGSPTPLVAGILQAVNTGSRGNETGMGQFAISGSGALLYASGGIVPTRTSSLVRVDRNGKETKLAEIQGDLGGLRVSLDGSRAVGDRSGDGSRASDLWSYELRSGSATRLTSTGDSRGPLFSPDGKSITYQRDGGNAGVYSLETAASLPPKLLLDGAKDAITPASWSPDGKWLASVEYPGGLAQLFARPMQPPGDAKPFAASTFATRDAAFFPDGRWIAYTSNESGASEVYVQAFPGPGAKHRISLTGGTNPVWSRNGRELFYLQSTPATPLAIKVTAAAISNQDGSRVGAPSVLFEGPYRVSALLGSYDVTPDGKFIMSRVTSLPDLRVTKINVLLGWAEELKRRVPSQTPAR